MIAKPLPSDNIGPNLWWLIITLFVVIIIEVILLILKQSKKLRMFIPLLAIPSNAYLIIVLEIIIILVLLYYLLKDYYKKEKNKTIEEEKIKILAKKETEKALYNYSLQASLILAKKETKDNYLTLKNFMLQYENITLSQNWKYDNYIYKGKTILKVGINNNTINCYLSVDYIDDSKYKIIDVSHIKKHQTTPVLIKVRGPRLLNYVQELINNNYSNLIIKDEYKKEELDLPNKNKNQLIEDGLIKITTISKKFHETINGE